MLSAQGTRFLFTKLQLNLDIILNQAGELKVTEDSLYDLLDHRLGYLNTIKSKIDFTAEELDEDTIIRNNIYKLMTEDQGLLSEVFLKWCARHIHPNSGFTDYSVENNFPVLALKDQDGRDFIICDLMSGRFIQADQAEAPTVIPPKLANSRLYHTFDKQNVSHSCYVTNIEYGGNRSYKIEMSNTDPKHYYVETPNFKEPFVLHCEKELNGQREYYELQSIGGYSSSLGRLESSQLGAQHCFMELPSSFFCESTRFWRGVQHPDTAIIERADRTFCIKQNEVELLDDAHQETGFVLVHPKMMEEKDPLNAKIRELYQCFENFENVNLIEIFYQKTPGIKPELKILFPRYGLELHANLSPLQIWDSKNSNWELSTDQETPIKNFSAPLVFKHKLTQEIKGIIPVQEFYARKKSEMASQAANEDSYFPFIYDTNLKVKSQLLKDSNVDVDNSPWKLVDSEKTLEVTWGPNLKLVRGIDRKDNLTLAYLYLCRFQPEKALSYLLEMNRTGGLAGTLEELTLIEKIMNAVPRLSNEATISNPKYIAVKAHAIDLVCHYIEKGNVLNIPNNPYNPNAESKDEQIKALEYARLLDFYKGKNHDESQDTHPGLINAIQTTMNSYHHTRNNIPSFMQLSMSQEFEILRHLHKNQTPQGALGARYENLKAAYLHQELGYLQSLHLSQTALKQRQEQIEIQILKHKRILKNTSQIVSSEKHPVLIVTPSIFSYKPSYEDKNHIQDSMNIGETWNKQMFQVPQPGMSYRSFLYPL